MIIAFILNDNQYFIFYCISADIPAVVTITPHTSDYTFDGVYIPDACKQLEDCGATVVGLNCGRGPKTLMPLVKEAMKLCKVR